MISLRKYFHSPRSSEMLRVFELAKNQEKKIYQGKLNNNNNKKKRIPRKMKFQF